MNPHRGLPVFLLPVSCLVATAAIAQEAPEKALKYHEALLKRPHNAALFDRFFGAWIDEQPVEMLEAFLKARAEANGGQEWTVLATYQLRRGREEEALAALGKGIEAVPDDAALPMERAKLRLRRLEFDAARADLAKVAAGKDEVLALEAAKLTGKSWLREGKTEEAIKVWDAVLAAHPGDEDLLEDLVETAAAESETAQALIYADKLIAAGRDPYQKTLRMLRRGDLLAQAGRSDEAVEAYAAIFNQVGEGSWLEREVLAQIEKVFRRQDRIDDLSEQLKKLAETYPQRLLIHRQLAKMEAAQGDTDAAIGRFREVLKRSPGEKDLREEFVRLLTDGERFDDAAAELEKLIELSPADAGLHLQVAALRFRQGKPELVLAALNKAHELLGKDEGNGIRIAGLMLQYQLKEPGEALLTEFGMAANAGPAALEALAAQYGRTERKPEAIELLKKAAAGDDVDVLLRNAGAISALGESAVAFETLAARADQFSADPRFLAALAQSALAAEKAADAVPHVLKLVRLAKQPTELADGISLASRVITGADKVDEVRTALAAQPTRTAAETCLLASLIEDAGDFVAVGQLLDKNVDSLVIHFHAALLDRRGEFDAAIAVLSRLADTEEGKKAGYFKDLSELQQRAGKIPEALATVERWKLSAPGDKTAWVTGSRLLRESGKPDEAVKMTRQAVARFEGDSDLAASLASLHEEAGQWQDAEAIYWKLYDEAQSPADQARWAVQLAQLAQRTARIEELEEKLQDRARSNRRSIGPILAQAELARITNNEEKRRDLLLEAVRLQPKDLDLRLQIASLEDQSGNPERVVALLEEALPFDANGRVRNALAQAYLRQGQAVKGMRELRLLAGKTGFDPRSAESAAASLAGTKLYEEAIGFLRSELPDGGDWRSRYLLAVLLEEDGREAEALPVFLSLLQAQGEIPKLAVPPVAGRQNYYEQFSKEVQSMFRLVTSSQAAYKRENQSGIRYSMIGGPTLVGPFYLPNTVEDVRTLSTIHLAVLSRKKSGGAGDTTLAGIKAAGIGNVAFIADLVEQAGQGDMSKLLETHPDEPGLFEFVMASGGYGGRGMDGKLVRRVLEKSENLSPMARFNAWSVLTATAKPEDPEWQSLLAAARDCMNDKSPQNTQGIIYRLMYLLQGQQGICPEIHKPAVRELMLAAYEKSVKDEPKMAHSYYSLAVLTEAGNPDAWLAGMNSSIRESRKTPAQAGLGMGYRTRFGQMMQQVSRSSYSGNYNPWSSMGNLFESPNIDTLPIRSIPMQVILQFAPQPGYQQSIGKPLLSPAELVKRSGEIESPYLRAWLAVKAEDKSAVAKAMADEPPQEERCDFEMLRAVLALQDKKPADAFASLLKARAAAGSDREISGSINMALLGVAESLTGEERVSLAEEIQATFLQSRQIFGQMGAQVLAAQARKLGLEELAKRIEPAVPPTIRGGGKSAIAAAAIAGATTRSGSASNNSPDRVRKLLAEKKYEAAARETLQAIRAVGNRNGASYYQYQMRNLLEQLGKDGQAELIKLVEPGESKSLVKRLEYADVCMAVGKAGQALEVLEAISKERPDDAGITARLAFAIPADQGDRRLELMTRGCMDDAFVTQATTFATSLREMSDSKVSMDFYETITRWLETADPAVLKDANLTWVSYHAKEFFGGGYNSNLPSVLSNQGSDRGDKAAIERHTAICGRLARAMMRHASCAEEGFRLLAAPTDWKVEPAEMDEWARKALLASAAPAGAAGAQRSHQSFFTLVQGTGGSSSGEDLAESSSGSWLVKRLGEVKKPAEIFTPGFISELTKLNPKVGEIVVALSREVKDGDLEKLWESDLMKSGADRFSQMFRPLLIKRLATAPGATKFFVDKISAIKPGEVVNRNGGIDGNLQGLFLAAISGTATGKSGDLDAVARAISKAVFGEKVEFTDATGQMDYQRVNFMESLTNSIGNDARLLVRYQAAFFRLGVPVSQGEYGATRPFQNKRFSKVEEAEAFFESLGWLSDADRWEPYASFIYDTGSSGNGITIRIQPVLLMERALQYLNNGDMKRPDLIARLKERKSGRFGSLMIAAALSSGKERSTLAGQAFKESAAVLAKLPPERIESLAMVLPWLPDDVRSKLPESFRRKLQGVESKKREEAIAAADAFIASLNGRGNNNSMNELASVVNGLIPYDLDKAVAVFVAGDEAYTDSLARGGRYMYSSSDDWQYSHRDQAFNQIAGAGRGSSPFDSNPELQLRFLEKILASPSGKRLSWTITYRNENLFGGAVSPLMKKENLKPETGDVVEALEAFQALDADVKAVAFPCFLLAKQSTKPNGQPKHLKPIAEKVAKLVANDPQAARLATVRLAQWSWKAHTAEEKAVARTVITALFADESIPDVARVMIAGELLAVLPKDEMLDASVCAALSKLYQDYCAGERTAITYVSDSLFKGLVSDPLRDESAVSLYKSVAEAFWTNTALPKSAGHPQVPGSLARTSFIAAVLGNDTELVTKTFPRIRTLMTGKLVPVVSLIMLDRNDFAKQLVPAPAEAFEIESHAMKYDRQLEESLATLKQAGIDAPTLQKIEFELLDFPDGKEKDVPAESAEARAERLIASFSATPPHESVVPTTLRSLLRKAPSNPALLAGIDDWVKAHPITDFLGRSGGSRAASRARGAAIELHGNSAMRAFAAGDLSRLKLVQEAASAPPDTRNGGYQMSSDVVTLVREMSRAMWAGVCLGNTAGYKDGLAAWNDFAIQCAGPISYNPSQIEGVLAVSHFLACWAGDPAAFDKMCERLPEKTTEFGKKFNRQDGFTPFVKSLFGPRNLDNLPETISRGVFIEKALSQPGFVTACPRNIGWVENLAAQGQSEAISKLMENPPATLVPEFLPALHGYRARFLREKKPEEALVSCRKALELCPDDADSKHLRGTLKRDLAELLLTAKLEDEAKKALASLTPEEIPDDMRTSYLALAKKTGVKPVVSPLPPKKSETKKE